MSNYTYHGTSDLIAMPGRSVQTFPSGLVRVERSFVCRRGQEGNFRSQFAQGKLMPFDDGKPAIDGLYIFPDPQETARDDGFVEFRVTAYGRTNTTGSYSIRNRAEVFSARFSFYTAENQADNLPASEFNQTIGDVVVSEALVRRVVKLTDINYTDFIPQGVGIRYAESGLNIEDAGVLPSENRIPEDFISQQTGDSATIPIFPTIRTIQSEVSSQEFGIWKEIVYGVRPIINFNSGLFFDRSTIYFGGAIADHPLKPQITAISNRGIVIEFVKPVNATLAIIEIAGITIRVPIGVDSAFSSYAITTQRHRVAIGGLTANTSYSVKMTYYNDVSSAVAFNTTITTKTGVIDISGG